MLITIPDLEQERERDKKTDFAFILSNRCTTFVPCNVILSTLYVNKIIKCDHAIQMKKQKSLLRLFWYITMGKLIWDSTVNWFSWR